MEAVAAVAALSANLKWLNEDETAWLHCTVSTSLDRHFVTVDYSMWQQFCLVCIYTACRFIILCCDQNRLYMYMYTVTSTALFILSTEQNRSRAVQIEKLHGPRLFVCNDIIFSLSCFCFVTFCVNFPFLML